MSESENESYLNVIDLSFIPNSDNLAIGFNSKVKKKGRKKTDGPIFGGQILKMRQQNEQAGQEGLAPFDQPVGI